MKQFIGFLLFFSLAVSAASCDTSGIAITFAQIIGGLTGNNHHGQSLNILPENLFVMTAAELARLEFDTEMKWSTVKNLPAIFKPASWLELSKDPGLGVRSLHRRGFTGAGIALAVIDKPIDPNHTEFTGRISYYQVVTDSARVHNYRLHYHGIACASIMCGTECGVVPDAELYYIAIPDDVRDVYNYCLAIDKLVDINASLPEEKKIQAVSISHYVARSDNPEELERWAAAVNKAKKSGIAVIYSDLNTTHAFFTGGGCPPYLDKSNPANYTLSSWARDFTDKIIVPADYRTTAGNKSKNHFVYWGEGGFSWAIPYITGLAGLAWSIDNSLTIEDIYRLLSETKTATASGTFVVDPAGFIAAVETWK